MTIEAIGKDGRVSFDGQWVRISPKGALGRALKGGSGELAFHISQVTGIDLKRPGITSGRITVIAQGAKGNLAVRQGAVHRSDPATVLYPRRRRRQFEQFADAVRNGVATWANSQRPAAGPRDVPEQLAQLADLHQRGAISDAEFAAGKQRILAGQ